MLFCKRLLPNGSPSSLFPSLFLLFLLGLNLHLVECVNLETLTTSSLRLAGPSELQDLLHLSPLTSTSTSATKELRSHIFNTGLYSRFRGITRSGRLVFSAPSLHHVAYQIPYPEHPEVAELLVAENLGRGTSEGTVTSHGWMNPSIFWHKPSNDADMLRYDVAFRLDDGRYLVGDSVPLGGVSVVKAPWGEGVRAGGAGGAGGEAGAWRRISDPHRAHVDTKFTGHITE